jgi:ribosomal protein S18 acetylase RimI-like enzyme
MRSTADIQFKPLGEADYNVCMDLWRSTEGVGISTSDTAESFCRFLRRNPGMSFCAVSDGSIAGTILCGHDGRRGYIYHLAVSESFRRRKIATRLLDYSMDILKKQGIDKCTLFVFDSNDAGRSFWLASGWKERADLRVLQKELESGGPL